MTGEPRDWAAELLHLWFQELAPSDWFGSSDAVDQTLKQRFESDLLALRAKPATDFLTDLQTARAAILLFDQVPRNIYRGTAEAFAFDGLAREITKGVIAKGWDAEIPDKERQFIAMPLMHSEDIADQQASVDYFETHLPGNGPFAKSHHEMIARFGRFPHRNAALGRETTEDEQAAVDAGFSW